MGIGILGVSRIRGTAGIGCLLYMWIPNQREPLVSAKAWTVWANLKKLKEQLMTQTFTEQNVYLQLSKFAPLWLERRQWTNIGRFVDIKQYIQLRKLRCLVTVIAGVPRPALDWECANKHLAPSLAKSFKRISATVILLLRSAMNCSLAADRLKPHPEWLIRFYGAQSYIVPPISVACCMLLIIVVVRCSPPTMGAFKWLGISQNVD